MKYILTIEANSLQEILSKFGTTEGKSYESFKKELNETKLPSDERTKKAWTEFELNFLTENYKLKKTRWIAKALHRPVQAIQQKLLQMYKKGLPRKQQRTKNL